MGRKAAYLAIDDTALPKHGRPSAGVARAKDVIPLSELDRVRAAGVPFGCVLAGLRLLWAIGIARNQKSYGADVQLVPLTFRDRHHHQGCLRCAGPSCNGCSPHMPPYRPSASAASTVSDRPT